MNKQREALEKALLALEIAPLDHNSVKSSFFEKRHYAIIALREALAEPEPEPVAWTTTGQIAAMDSGFLRYIEGRDPRFVLGRHDDVPLYTAPPARKPLTDSELWKMWVESPSDVLRFARAIERAHGIGD